MANRITLRLSWLFVKFCYYLLPVLVLVFKVLLGILGVGLIFALFMLIL